MRCQHAQRALALHLQEIVRVFHIQHRGGGVVNVVHNRGGDFNRRARGIVYFQRGGNVVTGFERHAHRAVKRKQPKKARFGQHACVFAKQRAH